MHTKLKELKKNKKISSTKMAKMLGISVPFYSQIENRTRRLSYEMSVKIATILKTSPDEIFYEDYKGE